MKWKIHSIHWKLQLEFGFPHKSLKCQTQQYILLQLYIELSFFGVNCTNSLIIHYFEWIIQFVTWQILTPPFINLHCPSTKHSDPRDLVHLKIIPLSFEDWNVLCDAKWLLIHVYTWNISQSNTCAVPDSDNRDSSWFSKHVASSLICH